MATTKRRRRPATTAVVAPEPIVINVRSLSVFAFAAGLSADLAEELLVDIPDDECSVAEHPCPSAECGGASARILFAHGAFQGRTLIYCDGCGEADVWL